MFQHVKERLNVKEILVKLFFSTGPVGIGDGRQNIRLNNQADLRSLKINTVPIKVRALKW